MSSTWQIKLPVRNPGERLTVKAAGELADLLPDAEDRAATFELLTASHQVGVFAGKALDVGLLSEWLAELEPGRRRHLLDLARRKAGLPSIHQVEQRRAFEAAQMAGDLRRRESTPAQCCHSPGCVNVPVDPTTGIQTATDAARWFCPEHLDQALPGDLEPSPSPLRPSPSGAGFADVEQAEAEESRQAVDARHRAVEREQKLRERAVESAGRAEFEEAMADAWRPANLLPPR